MPNKLLRSAQKALKMVKSVKKNKVKRIVIYEAGQRKRRFLVEFSSVKSGLTRFTAKLRIL